MLFTVGVQRQTRLLGGTLGRTRKWSSPDVPCSTKWTWIINVKSNQLHFFLVSLDIFFFFFWFFGHFYVAFYFLPFPNKVSFVYYSLRNVLAIGDFSQSALINEFDQLINLVSFIIFIAGLAHANNTGCANTMEHSTQ